MTPTALRRLYDYTNWANARMLDVIAGLDDEQFTRHVVSSYSSIRDTLAHIASAEWLWLLRWKGDSRLALPEWMEASFARLREEMESIAADRRAFLGDLTDERADAMLHYRSIRGDAFALPLREVLIHCANHSTYHRGQLVTMLRQVGVTELPSTDYALFVRSLA